jgi:hypothetical protein
MALRPAADVQKETVPLLTSLRRCGLAGGPLKPGFGLSGAEESADTFSQLFILAGARLRSTARSLCDELVLG